MRIGQSVQGRDGQGTDALGKKVGNFTRHKFISSAIKINFEIRRLCVKIVYILYIKTATFNDFIPFLSLDFTRSL